MDYYHANHHYVQPNHFMPNPHNHPQNHNHHNHHNIHHNHNAAHKGKQLMSFQNYVRTLSNAVDETTAFKKYRDFLADLSQSKVGRFFDANKDKEWFRLRYHPVENQKTLQDITLNHSKRLKVFNELNGKNCFTPLCVTYTPSIINLMDAVIVALEDGPQDLIDNLLASTEPVDSDVRLTYVPNKHTSIVIDDLNIETTVSEITQICQQAHPDLLRIASLDPYYVKGGALKRKFVVVYKSHVDIKDVCWKITRTKLNNKQLNVYINKSVSNRIQTVDAVYNHRTAVVNDIRQAIVLILNFDELRALHDRTTAKTNVEASTEGNLEEENVDINTLDEEKEKEKKKLLEFKFNLDMCLCTIIAKLSKNNNPILENAYLYLVEFNESTAANYLISKVPVDLGGIQTSAGGIDKVQMIEMIVKNLPGSLEDDTRYLDKLLWYLRIVHSFDYYKKAIYKQEDELTLRLGVIHIRGDPADMPEDLEDQALTSCLKASESAFQEFGRSQSQKYVSRDEERFNYKSYGKVTTDELTSYAQRIQKPGSGETEEVYKCKHCTKEFQKLSDIGRHFVSKHRWAIDAIELDTDFFNAYLFDCNKINPCPPKEMLENAPNRFSRLAVFSQMGEDPDLLRQTVEAYSKMESFVREPAPRAQVESDPRNESFVDYSDISFDDAI